MASYEEMPTQPAMYAHDHASRSYMADRVRPRQPQHAPQGGPMPTPKIIRLTRSERRTLRYRAAQAPDWLRDLAIGRRVLPYLPNATRRVQPK